MEKGDAAEARAARPRCFDGLVKMLSSVWSTLERRQGRPLADRDLLDGHTVVGMAQWLHAHWPALAPSIERTLRTLVGYDLRFGLHYRSENALTLVAAACFSLEHWASRDVPGREHVGFEIAAANSRWLICEILSKWLPNPSADVKYGDDALPFKQLRRSPGRQVDRAPAQEPADQLIPGATALTLAMCYVAGALRAIAEDSSRCKADLTL